MDKTTLWTVSEAFAEAMTEQTYNKHRAQTNGLHRIISIKNNTVTIDDNGDSITVSVDSVAHAPSSLLRQFDHPYISAYQLSVPTPRSKKD